MKKIFLLISLINIVFISLYGQSKVKYVYDSAGNRVERVIILSTKGSSIEKEEATPHFLEESISKQQVRFYPNPVKTNLTLEIGNIDNEFSGELMLYDQLGRLLQHQKIDKLSTNIDMSNYASGYYVMKIIIKGEQSTWKVIKE